MADLLISVPFCLRPRLGKLNSRGAGIAGRCPHSHSAWMLVGTSAGCWLEHLQLVSSSGVSVWHGLGFHDMVVGYNGVCIHA